LTLNEKIQEFESGRFGLRCGELALEAAVDYVMLLLYCVEQAPGFLFTTIGSDYTEFDQ
jgi:hypothetical protein